MENINEQKVNVLNGKLSDLRWTEKILRIISEGEDITFSIVDRRESGRTALLQIKNVNGNLVIENKDAEAIRQQAVAAVRAAIAKKADESREAIREIREEIAHIESKIASSKGE